MDELRDILNTRNSDIHIIILTETWIYSDEVLYFDLPSYTAVHNCRSTRGGGVCIYINNAIAFQTRDVPVQEPHDCNIAAIYLSELNYMIYGIYRPPSSDSRTYVNLMDGIMEREDRPTLIVGDMNLDLLKESHTVREYKNIIGMSGFNIQNDLTLENATRVTTTNAAVLDHVLANKSITCKIALDDHPISDHRIMIIEVVNKCLHVNKKGKITREKLHKQEWIEKVQRKTMQGDVNSFEKLATIINETKRECTKIIKLRSEIITIG